MNPVTIRTPFVPGPVACARDVPLVVSSSGQPILDEALLDYFAPIIIGLITTKIQNSDDPRVDGTSKETVREVRTSGCFQAGPGESLAIGSGGERSWQNGLLHTTPDFNVQTDTILRIAGVRYRIMKKGDWSVNGFVRYELLEDYVPAGSIPVQ